MPGSRLPSKLIFGPFMICILIFFYNFVENLPQLYYKRLEFSEKSSYIRGGEGSKALLRLYYQYLKLERGLSGNTLDAYTEDLRKLLGFLWEEGLDFRTVSVDELHIIIAELADVGIGPRSMARI